MTDLNDYRWLISDAAVPWLQKVADDLTGGAPTVGQIRALRSAVGIARASLLIEQAQLRSRALEKFSQASELFFTRQGLEQATDERLAAYKATRFAGLGAVADLCCGIGGDAMALALDRSITLVDRDAISLLFDEANVRHCNGQTVTCLAENVRGDHVREVDAWHLDPDRRTTGKRTSRVELGEPGIETIEALRTQCAAGAIKLAPAADVPEEWSAAGEREWIETRGECRQQMIWLGELADAPSTRTATLIDDAGEACSFSSALVATLPLAGQVQRYLLDPSPSLVAAKMLGSLATALELGGLSSQSPYLTAEEAVVHPHLQCFEIEAELPLDVRKLKAHLQSRRIGRLEIKKRGIDITPETLRPQLQLTGDNAATLILAKLGDAARAFVCRRVVGG